MGLIIEIYGKFVHVFVVFCSGYFTVFLHLCDAVTPILQCGFTCAGVIVLLPLKDMGNINGLQTKPKTCQIP